MPHLIKGLRGLISFLIVINFACSAKERRKDDFESIEIGMRKRDVLDTAGNPRYTDRRDGVDRWYYYLVPENPESLRVIHFKKNRVVYKGEKQKPLLTVEEEEAIHAPKTKPYIRTMSDEELRELIKKDLKKEKEKKKSGYEKI